jgi:DNA primase
MHPSHRALQCHCQDDEACRHPAARNVIDLWPGRQTARSIMAMTRVSQIAKKRREMLETGHFNSFSNI